MLIFPLCVKHDFLTYDRRCSKCRLLDVHALCPEELAAAIDGPTLVPATVRYVGYRSHTADDDCWGVYDTLLNRRSLHVITKDYMEVTLERLVVFAAFEAQVSWVSLEVED